MKLRADHSQFSDCAFHFIDCAFAFPGIDTGEPYKLPWVFSADVGYLIVSQRRQAGCGLGIPGQQHSYDVQFFIEPRYLVHFADRNLVTEIGLGRFSEGLYSAVQKARGGKMNVHINRFCHSKSPRCSESIKPIRCVKATSMQTLSGCATL